GEPRLGGCSVGTFGAGGAHGPRRPDRPLRGRTLARGALRPLALALRRGPALGLRRHLERQAGDGEAAGDVELADLVDREAAAARAIPVPDAVVEAEDRP